MNLLACVGAMFWFWFLDPIMGMVIDGISVLLFIVFAAAFFRDRSTSVRFLSYISILCVVMGLSPFVYFCVAGSPASRLDA